MFPSRGEPTHLPTPPPRPPFSAPKYGRGGGAGLGTGAGLNSVPSQSQGLLGSTDTYTDLRGRRGLTSFCFSPRPKGNRKMVSGQGKRARTRGTWADTGSGHVMAARHRQAQIPSYHFDRRRWCRKQPMFPDPHNTPDIVVTHLCVYICLFLVTRGGQHPVLRVIASSSLPLPLITPLSLILLSSATKAHYFPYSSDPVLKFDCFSLMSHYHMPPLPGLIHIHNSIMSV